MKRVFFLVLLIAYFSPCAFALNPWKITVDSIDASKYYGVSVGNGMIGIVSSPEPLKVGTVVLAGTYDLYGRGRVNNLINNFNLLNTRIIINGKSINASNVKNFHQELDMKSGTFSGSFNYLDIAEVRYSYCALRHLPYSVLMSVEIKAYKTLKLSAINMLETPESLRDGRAFFNEINRAHIGIQLMSSTAQTPTGKSTICASTSFMFTEKRGDEPGVIHETPDNNLHQMRFSKQIDAGQTYRYGLVGTTLSSATTRDPLNEAERLTIFARLEGIERLWEKHQLAWDDLWKSDIEIDGDAQAQQDVHNMLYHLYSFSREGSDLSIPPMGLSGLGYNGHIFWDADVWMMPVLLIMHPEMVRSHLEYRYKQLPDAKRNAMSHGYKGAMYPWESADTGNEETPVWALAGPFEHHITACVALSAWQYYCITQDKEWLREKGWPIISASADFWLSRVQRNEKGYYEIRNVVAADEWAENVDNDAFTNASARINLQNATEAARILRITPNKEWKTIADKIIILQFEQGVTREHSTYNGENIKQADVNLLAYPLRIIKDAEQIRRDLKYYEQRVPEKGTPAMTQAIFSLLYARLGEQDKAAHYFSDAYRPNLNPPFRVIAETKNGTNPYFVTGAGGVLQAVLMGFGGLEISQSGITQLKSILPKDWKQLRIKTGANNSTTKIFTNSNQQP